LLTIVEALCKGEEDDGEIPQPDPGRIPEALAASYEHPNKEDAVRARVTRFNAA